MGDLVDSKTAELLASELIDRGCLADQFVFLNNRAARVRKKRGVMGLRCIKYVK